MSNLPTFNEYTGGGSILNSYTTVRNLISECEANQVILIDVFELICQGLEVMVLNGKIVAAQVER